MTTRVASHTNICVLALGLLLSFGVSAQAEMWYGPTSYIQFSDSPFFGLIFSSSYLEDFEDGLLNTPGVSVAGGSIYQPTYDGVNCDSVDADDGAIDGDNTGYLGNSWWAPGDPGITFTFDAGVLGSLPTHVGIVWTDGYGTTKFEAFDSGGTSLGFIDAGVLGVSGEYTGETAEDRFFGVSDVGGISRIKITTGPSSGVEVDHLQYGIAAVPLPGAALLGAIGIGYSGWRLRRRTG